MHPFNQYEQITARHEARRNEFRQSRRVKSASASQPGVIQTLIRRGKDVTTNLLKSLRDRLYKVSTKLQEQPAPPETGMLEWSEK